MAHPSVTHQLPSLTPQLPLINPRAYGQPPSVTANGAPSTILVPKGKGSLDGPPLGCALVPPSCRRQHVSTLGNQRRQISQERSVCATVEQIGTFWNFL